MRIVSKFRDYYDSVQGFGQDLTTVFIRKAEALSNDSPLLSTLSSRDVHNQITGTSSQVKIRDKKVENFDLLSTSTFRIYFCGKVYRGIKAKLSNRIYMLEGSDKKELYFYTMEELSEFLQTLGLLVQDICRGYFSSDKQELAAMARFLSSQGTDEKMEDLVKHRIVIAKHISERWNEDRRSWDAYWELNGSLAEVKFFKLVDPYTAYQELDMYLSGVLGQQAKEVINISDKDRVRQRGFDEYSFRKLPEERKKK